MVVVMMTMLVLVLVLVLLVLLGGGGDDDSENATAMLTVLPMPAPQCSTAVEAERVLGTGIKLKCACHSAEGNVSVTVSDNQRNLNLRDEKLQVVQNLQGHVDVVTDLAMSYNGIWLASGSLDGMIKVQSECSWTVQHANKTSRTASFLMFLTFLAGAGLGDADGDLQVEPALFPRRVVCGGDGCRARACGWRVDARRRSSHRPRSGIGGCAVRSVDVQGDQDAVGRAGKDRGQR
eukprot:1798584-Rhodomonas_salina.1